MTRDEVIVFAGEVIFRKSWKEIYHSVMPPKEPAFGA